MKKRSYWKLYLGIYSTIVLCSISGNLAIKMNPTPHIVSPLAHASEVQPVSEHDQIVNYIKVVFGKDANKAFKLLSCENPSLNPRAINHNGTWSTDWGLFQLNDYYQGITNKDFLFDYKINTNIAYKIYVSWGNKFSAWTCGKLLHL